MGQCCGKIPSEDDVQSIRDSIDESYDRQKAEEEAIELLLTTVIYTVTHDLSISSSPDPFSDPIAEQINSKEWITSEGNHIVSWYSKTENQINFKVVSGPDRGAHKFFNYDTFHQGQTGVENFRPGHEGERRK